jgi:hypothetical protein
LLPEFGNNDFRGCFGQSLLPRFQAHLSATPRGSGLDCLATRPGGAAPASTSQSEASKIFENHLFETQPNGGGRVPTGFRGRWRQRGCIASPIARGGEYHIDGAIVSFLLPSNRYWHQSHPPSMQSETLVFYPINLRFPQNPRSHSTKLNPRGRAYRRVLAASLINY